MKTDEYQIDTHKLMYHPNRVSKWLNGDIISPIYVEISPYGGCNQRCFFCSFNYMEYKPIKLDTKILLSTITNMANFGVKSIMFAGEGEPLLHSDLSKIINHTKANGIDCALTTNGVLLNKTFLKECLKSLSWIKISVDANEPKTYAKIHGTSEKDYQKLIQNLKLLSDIKNKYSLECTLGTQILLLRDNINEVYPLAEHLGKIGMDYLVVKPFTDHPYRKGNIKEKVKYQEFLTDLNKTSKIDSLKIIVRQNAFKKLNNNRNYNKCYALDFWSYLSANGDVYSCSNFLGNENYVYGNIYNLSFEDIWKKRKSLSIDIKNCRMACRMDEINQYLWKLKNPDLHVNFI